LTAVDVYSATFTAMFGPLSSAQCKMDPSTRAAFESRDQRIEAAHFWEDHRDNNQQLKYLIFLVPGEGLEPPTNGLQKRC
jgi:hypothetical protein